MLSNALAKLGLVFMGIGLVPLVFLFFQRRSEKRNQAGKCITRNSEKKEDL